VSQADLPNEMIQACRWLAQHEYVAASDGILSVRVSPQEIMMTPQGQSWNRVTSDQLVLLALDGTKAQQERQPSPAYRLHLFVYRRRKEVGVVINAQPPSATAFAVAGIPLIQPVLPETVLTFGSVPLAKYATPYTEEAEQAIGDLIEQHDALLLKNRGLMILGLDLSEALQKLDQVERLANVLLRAKALGHVDILTGTQVNKLMALRKRLKLKGKNPWMQIDPEGDNG
jgi:L-fuculose-phosphate aldolase